MIKKRQLKKQNNIQVKNVLTEVVIQAESRPLTSVRADTQKIRHGFILCDDSGLTLKLSSVVEVHRRAADNALRVLK